LRSAYSDLRWSPSVLLIVLGLLMAVATVVIFGLNGFRSQILSILGVGGIILFSIGVIVWHTEP
jgi:hypothetical protein